MAIKITAKNNKLKGTFLGDIKFDKGVAEVKGSDVEKQRAIVFAERSGLDWEDTSKVEVSKTAKKK